jgi:hypothetical protein
MHTFLLNRFFDEYLENRILRNFRCTLPCKYRFDRSVIQGYRLDCCCTRYQRNNMNQLLVVSKYHFRRVRSWLRTLRQIGIRNPRIEPVVVDGRVHK